MIDPQSNPTWLSLSKPFPRFSPKPKRKRSPSTRFLLSTSKDSGKSGYVGQFLITIARLWQLGPSRILPPTCRFAPSCSEFAIEALHRHGATRGGWLALRRIARCHPFGGHGHDPVP